MPIVQNLPEVLMRSSILCWVRVGLNQLSGVFVGVLNHMLTVRPDVVFDVLLAASGQPLPPPPTLPLPLPPQN